MLSRLYSPGDRVHVKRDLDGTAWNTDGEVVKVTSEGTGQMLEIQLLGSTKIVFTNNSYDHVQKLT